MASQMIIISCAFSPHKSNQECSDISQSILTLPHMENNLKMMHFLFFCFFLQLFSLHQQSFLLSHTSHSMELSVDQLLNGQ